MQRASWPLFLVLTLTACPTYHEYPKLADQDGLLEADVYARYGVEQAQAMAVAREYGHFHQGTTRNDLRLAADSAMAFARTMPDITDVTADSLGHRLTLHFRSGWRTMVVPIDDGKRGPETANLPGGSSAAE